MSHQEKQRIFDEYPRLNGFGNWIKLKVHHDNRSEDYDEHIFAACNLFFKNIWSLKNKVLLLHSQIRSDTDREIASLKSERYKDH